MYLTLNTYSFSCLFHFYSFVYFSFIFHFLLQFVEFNSNFNFVLFNLHMLDFVIFSVIWIYLGVVIEKDKAGQFQFLGLSWNLRPNSDPSTEKISILPQEKIEKLLFFDGDNAEYQLEV